jgi:hypothetical protein
MMKRVPYRKYKDSVINVGSQSQMCLSFVKMQHVSSGLDVI